jgi:hypothetical protein
MARTTIQGTDEAGAIFEPSYIGTPADAAETDHTEEATTWFGWIKGIVQRLGQLVSMFTDGSAKFNLSGSLVTIGAKTYPVSNGDTVRGLAADKPAAADAHAAIPYCYYHNVDSGVIEVTTGTAWVVM